MKVLMCVLLVLASFAIASDAYEDARSETPEYTGICDPGPVWDGPRSELYSNGPWWNSVGTGVGGADESLLELPGTTWGWGFQNPLGYIIADDFTVPAGETWTIESITCFGYQTNSGTTPTINGLFLALYDDGPTSGPSLIWGNMTTNVMSSVAWSNVYRLNEALSGTNTDRPIMAATADLSPSVILTEGTYWLYVNMAGSGASGPWAPPIVISGQPATGNAYQYITSWLPITDTGSSAPQGIPFVLEGTPAALEQSTWGGIKSVFQ
jgi:hypothetical protein